MVERIDIIMPVYNTPGHDIDLIMRSLQEQEHTNWRLCVIDDGSKKETADYLDFWSGKDSRVEIYHFKNGGPPVARNRGLSLVTSAYFMLIDSDDILAPNFLSHSLELCKDYDLDLIVGAIEIIKENGEVLEICRPEIPNETNILVYEEKKVSYLLDYALSTHSNSENSELKNALLGRLYPKLIRTELIHKNNIRFDESLFNHDDNIFSFDLFAYSNRVGLTNCIYYKYIEHEYSIVHRKASEKILNEEIQFIKVLRSREQLYTIKGCKGGIAVRYLNLVMASMAVVTSLQANKARDAYRKITGLIDVRSMVGSISSSKYTLTNKEKVYYNILKIKTPSIRENVLCGFIALVALYKKFRHNK